jgi:hypothetical protein
MIAFLNYRGIETSLTSLEANSNKNVPPFQKKGGHHDPEGELTTPVEPKFIMNGSGDLSTTTHRGD